jgi:hypothetical protein
MFDGSCDCFQHACTIGHHLVIAETQNAKALASKKGVPARVALLLL